MVTLEFPNSGPIGAFGYNNFLDSHVIGELQTWVLANSNLRFFNFKQVKYINVVFANGDVARFAVTGFASLTNFPLLLVTDKDNNVISIVASNSVTTESVNGGAGTLFTLPGGVLICWGECNIPDTIVIIKSDPPPEPE